MQISNNCDTTSSKRQVQFYPDNRASAEPVKRKSLTRKSLERITQAKKKASHRSHLIGTSNFTAGFCNSLGGYRLGQSLDPRMTEANIDALTRHQ